MRFESDDDILDYLMTSEFVEEDLNPDDLKELLFKFRYFYRLSHSKQTALQHQIDELNNKVDVISEKIKKLEKEIEYRHQKYESLKSKKLTWRERIKGKIIT